MSGTIRENVIELAKEILKTSSLMQPAGFERRFWVNQKIGIIWQNFWNLNNNYYKRRISKFWKKD